MLPRRTCAWRRFVVRALPGLIGNPLSIGFAAHALPAPQPLSPPSPGRRPLVASAQASASTDDMSAALEATPSNGVPAPSRKRTSYSCTECRRRKKHCDRQVPGCSQCRLRGEVHLCRWGDERDEVAPTRASQRRRTEASPNFASSTIVHASPTAETDESTVSGHGGACRLVTPAHGAHPRRA